MDRVIIRKGNDTQIVVALTEQGTEQVINLNEVLNLEVSLSHCSMGIVVTPAWTITEAGALVIEFNAPDQELGRYNLNVSFDRPSNVFTDRLQRTTWSRAEAISVVRPTEEVTSEEAAQVSGVIASMLRGERGRDGEPGDPTVLLEALSQQQREGLSRIAERLSQEQRGQLGDIAETHLPQIVSDKLPAVVLGNVKAVAEEVSDNLARDISIDDESRLVVGGRVVSESLKGDNGADGVDGAMILSDQVALYADTATASVVIDNAWFSTNDALTIATLEDYVDTSTLGTNMIKVRDKSWLYNPGLIRDNMPGMYNERTKHIVLELSLTPRSDGVISLMALQYEQYWTGLTMEVYYSSEDGAKVRQSYYKPWVNGSVPCVWRTDVANATKVYVLIRCDQYYPVLRSINMMTSKPVVMPKPRGVWADRPKSPYVGQMYIGTDMRHNGVGDLPMWYNGVMWIDYEGHDVTRRYLIE